MASKGEIGGCILSRVKSLWLENADNVVVSGVLCCAAVADTPFVRTCIQSCTADGPAPPVAGEDGLAVLETVRPPAATIEANCDQNMICLRNDRTEQSIDSSIISNGMSWFGFCAQVFAVYKSQASGQAVRCAGLRLE